MFYDTLSGVMTNIIFPIFNIQMPYGFSYGIFVCGAFGIIVLFKYIRGIN